MPTGRTLEHSVFKGVLTFLFKVLRNPPIEVLYTR